MFPITVYHGSATTSCFDGELSELYVTPDPAYGYIQQSEQVYQAEFSPKAPFWTDNVGFIEGLRSRPEQIKHLQTLGYDAVLYADPRNLLKGPSGWGNDRAQCFVLSPSTLTQWRPCDTPSPYLSTEQKPPIKKRLIGPVFHGTSEHFIAPTLGDEIGVHFGTQQAATDRLHKTHQHADVSVYHIAPSTLDRLRVEQNRPGACESVLDMVYAMMLRKLGHPKADLKQTLSDLSPDELANVAETYNQKPDHPHYLQAIERVEQGECFEIMCAGKHLFTLSDRQEAEAMKHVIEHGLMKKAMLLMQNPLEVDDLGGWSPYSILQAIPGYERYLERFAACVAPKEQLDVVRDALVDAGYDGLCYRNQVEDEGSLSYIAIDPQQVIFTPLDLSPLRALLLRPEEPLPSRPSVG